MRIDLPTWGSLCRLPAWKALRKSFTSSGAVTECMTTLVCDLHAAGVLSGAEALVFEANLMAALLGTGGPQHHDASPPEQDSEQQAEHC